MQSDLKVKSNQPIYLFNTLTRKKEKLTPIKSGHISMYTCGPTVYDFAHIGNFRTYVFEDLLRRTLKFFGYQVFQVMNLTDVDDKTIKGAIKDQQSLTEYTKQFKDAFFKDLDALNIERVEAYPAATDYIPQMIHFIEVLLEKKFAYIGKDNSVYFSIRSFPNYGHLSHLNLNELKTNASNRLDVDEYDKNSASDFVLWKSYDETRDGPIFWDSPFGKGRPGWHIECSTMAMELLGKSIDIHVGGVDNIFPHHENEIAQTEACTGTTFANLWLHSEHLIVENKKMSKSYGNFYTLRDLLNKQIPARQVRLLLLQTHYKTQLNFTFEAIDAAKHSLQRIDSFLERLKSIKTPTSSKKIFPILQHALDNFSANLADDLNISAALAAVFNCIREVNTLIDANELSMAQADTTLELFQLFDTVLGISSQEEARIPQDCIQLAEMRDKARKEKNWAEADRIRALLLEKGYSVEDSPNGFSLKKI